MVPSHVFRYARRGSNLLMGPFIPSYRCRIARSVSDIRFGSVCVCDTAQLIHRGPPIVAVRSQTLA